MKTALLQICLRRSISWITFRNYFKSKKLRNNTTYRHLKITTPSRRTLIMLFNWWDIFEQVCQSSRSRISTECLTIHYRKYKNNEKTVIFKRRGQDIQNSGWWHRRRQLDHPMVLMLEMSHDCMCVCGVCFCLCMQTSLHTVYIVFLCVRWGTNKFNKYKSQTHFIHKETVWSKKRAM